MTPNLIEHAHETKSVPASGEVADAFDDFARTFDAFRQTNDRRLGEIETRLGADVVTEEKLARIDTALDDAKRRLDRLQIESRRPNLAGSAPDVRDPALIEHKTAFDLYVRAGESDRAEAPGGEGALGRLRPRWRLSRAAGHRDGTC